MSAICAFANVVNLAARAARNARCIRDGPFLQKEPKMPKFRQISRFAAIFIEKSIIFNRFYVEISIILGYIYVEKSIIFG